MVEPEASGEELPLHAAPGWGGVFNTLVGIALLAALVLAVEPLREAVGNALQGDAEQVRSDLAELEGVGPLIVLALALVHAVVFYPSEILDAAAGFVYGFWPALGLLMPGWVASALVGYGIGRSAARPPLYRLLGRDRFLAAERLISRGGVPLLLVMRLIPIVPFALFCYVAGAARVPVWTFTWTTAVGYVPITALFVYVGSNLTELSLTDPVLLGGFGALIAIALLSRRIVALARSL